MTLVELESGRKILIDTNIRAAADDPDDDTPDVATILPNRLDRDSQGRLGQRRATGIVDQLLTQIAGGLREPSNNVW